jgi:hypothetical protein
MLLHNLGQLFAFPPFTQLMLVLLILIIHDSLAFVGLSIFLIYKFIGIFHSISETLYTTGK